MAFTSRKNDNKDAYGKAFNGSGHQQERCFASVWVIRTWRRACSGVCGYRCTALGDRATLRIFNVRVSLDNFAVDLRRLLLSRRFSSNPWSNRQTIPSGCCHLD